MENFGERLKFLRATQSQAELAVALNIKQTTLSSYERCRNEPNFETLKKICSYFGVNTEWFMFGTGPMRTNELADTQAPQQPTENTQKSVPVSCASACGCCAKLERVEAERRELSDENRKLWKENSELRERCALLRGVQSTLPLADVLKKGANIPFNDAQGGVQKDQ